MADGTSSAPSAAQEFSRLSSAQVHSEDALQRLERLLDKIEKGEVDEELLDACPELVDAVQKNEKLKYRRLTLQRSLEEQRAANAAKGIKPNDAAKMPVTPAVNGNGGEELSAEVVRRRDLIVRHLAEVLGQDKLTTQLSSGKAIHLYWGSATTGRPHVGYLVPMSKLADYLTAGVKVTVLFADLHAFLDNMKSTWELLANRVVYYESVIKALLQSLEVPIEQLHFVKGSTYQLKREYTEDVLRLCSQVSQRDALKAGAEVVKQVESPLLSGLMYPLLQALDEHYLKVDGQFGGVDQRKIFILAEEQLPKLKMGKRWHLMNPMVPGLTGGKMSSSELNSKIDLLDDADLVRRKILNAACERGAEENGVLSFFEYVLIPIFSPKPVPINGKEYTCIEDIRNGFEGGAIEESQLKETLITFLNDLLAKVQKRCQTPVVEEALRKGYASEMGIEETPGTNGSAHTNGTATVDEKTKKQLEEVVQGAKLLNDDSSSLAKSLVRGSPIRVLYSIAPKGRFHLGFVAPLIKIRSLIRKGFNLDVTVLVSSLEAFLDNEKCAWTVREARSSLFVSILQSFVESLGISANVKVTRDLDCDFYMSSEYALDMYKLASIVTRDESSLVGGTALAGNLVPIIHTLNLKYLSPDLTVVGECHEPITQLALTLLSRSRLRPPSTLSIPFVPGMDEQKMSCSSLDFLLDPFDTPKQTKTKIARSFCEPQNVERNVALELARKVIFPLLDGQVLRVERSDNNGGSVECVNYADLASEFAAGTKSGVPVHPADLKATVVAQINGLFDPIRAKFAETQTKLLAAAFPTVKGGKKK